MPEASKTTSENIQQRLVGFPLTDLPRTIRDAVEFTRALGLHYLWVDAVCILQDQAKDDELTTMPDYYARATVVICAARAAHSNAGFSGPRRLLNLEYDLPIALTDGDCTAHGQIRVLERAAEQEREPIDCRAWTHQEQVNALATFRFESQKLLWECKESSLGDSDVDKGLSSQKSIISTSSIDSSIFSNMLPQPQSNTRETNLAKYLQVIIDYSFRQAGRLDDKLAAFEQTAKNWAISRSRTSSRYLAGLWEDDMPRELLWCRNYYWEDKSWVGDSTSGTTTPSWSWASIQSPITWQDLNDLVWPGYTIEIIDCEVEPLSRLHPFGKVKWGTLTVRGYVRQAFWNGQDLVVGPAGESINVVWDTPLHPTPQKADCLEIRSDAGYSIGIILNSKDGVSKRLGYYHYQPRKRGTPGQTIPEDINTDWLRQSERRVVNIH
ncbi:hypothetical protein PG989_005669 [Apiospora arundinis]